MRIDTLAAAVRHDITERDVDLFQPGLVLPGDQADRRFVKGDDRLLIPEDIQGRIAQAQGQQLELRCQGETQGRRPVDAVVVLDSHEWSFPGRQGGICCSTPAK